jgi:hypothetical protein
LSQAGHRRLLRDLQVVAALLDRVGPERFVLANSDSCPPDVEFEKFLLVSELVRKRGAPG